MDGNDKIQILKQKLEYYKKEGVYLYLKTKQEFKYNGTITKIGESFIILNDRFSGNIFVSFSEIDKVEPNYNQADKDKRWPG